VSGIGPFHQPLGSGHVILFELVSFVYRTDGSDVVVHIYARMPRRADPNDNTKGEVLNERRIPKTAWDRMTVDERKEMAAELLRECVVSCP
jgi:hypothetical protein